MQERTKKLLFKINFNIYVTYYYFKHTFSFNIHMQFTCNTFLLIIFFCV